MMMVVNDDESWPRKRSTVAAIIVVSLPDVALTHRTVVAARRSCLLPLVRTFHSRGFDQRKKEHRVPIFISHSIHLFSSNYSCLSVCGGKYGSICTRGRSKTKTMFGAAAVPGSRQGCFKCGNLGHIAENCQAPGRLCYNCREPGHESTNCPQPRSTDGKQCYACGGVGHVKSDCPSMRGAFGPGQKCFKCGRPGHLARECTVPGFVGAFRGRGGFGGAFGGRPRPPINPDGTPVKCYRCNGENHLARDCLAPRDEAAILASKKCYKCQETGHIARDCTQENVSPPAE